jgi:hypothetical protein
MESPVRGQRARRVRRCRPGKRTSRKADTAPWSDQLVYAGRSLRVDAGQPASRQASPRPQTDVTDACWLAELLECGLLAGSFVPPAVIRQLWDVTRYRKRLVQDRTREVQRIDKTLQDTAIKLDWASCWPSDWARRCSSGGW